MEVSFRSKLIWLVGCLVRSAHGSGVNEFFNEACIVKFLTVEEGRGSFFKNLHGTGIFDKCINLR